MTRFVCDETTVPTHVSLLPGSHRYPVVTHGADAPKLEMLSNKYMIQENVKFGSFLLEFSRPGNLDWDKIVVMFISLRHLQHQTGLLADEGLAGDV